MEILQKVRKLVPFSRDWSNVKYCGEHEPTKESYIKLYTWQNGWREEGQLLLDANGNPCGTLYYEETNGSGKHTEVPYVYPENDAMYLLNYEVKFDTEEEEWATLYRIKK